MQNRGYNNLNKYDIILDVCKTQNFTKTAQNLNYSQSAVSQAIKAFETEMGFPLFKRTNSGVKLLPVAQNVIQSLEMMKRAQENLSHLSDAMTKSEYGTVRIGSFFSFAVTYLPGILKDFSDLHPHIKFDIFTGNQDEIYTKLSNGDIDVAFTSKDSVLEFNFEEVIKDEFMAVLPIDHELSSSSSISIHDYKNMTYILSGEKFNFEIGNIINALQIHPDHKLEIYDEMVALKMIEAGFGVGIFSKFFLDSIPNHANVLIRPFKEHYYRSLVIATNDTYYTSASANVFLSHIKNWAKNFTY